MSYERRVMAGGGWNSGTTYTRYATSGFPFLSVARDTTTVRVVA